ncbi:MAG TPA: TlpA disulfide reductase family protein [Gemmataceae bacterium]|jgi:thiol-disulfide isomerase/thioredoxin
MRLTVLAFVLLTTTPGQAVAADPLTIGSPAPKLKVDTWVKGDPVSGIQKGKVYVIEFWGTACAPCIKCMPHLSDLQRQHKAVIFSCLSNEPEKSVRDFVAKHDKDMGFRVGWDEKGRMWKSWMGAADLEGIPTAFIVDAAGKIAWIGNPTEIDEPLQQILDGTFDPRLDVLRLRLRAAAKKQQQIENDRLDRYNKVAAKVEELTEQRKWDAARAAVEEASRDPKMDQDSLRHLKLSVLAGNPATANEAVDYAVDLAAVTRNTGGYDSISHSRSYFYQAQSLMRGYETSPNPRFADLAVALAEWAVNDLRHVTSEEERRELEYDLHQLQAHAHAARKRYRKAVAHQESALALFPKVNPQNRIKNWRPIEEAQLKAALAEYKKGSAGDGK